jgi:glycosyltransferase involved in cell wall biosynthesis
MSSADWYRILDGALAAPAKLQRAVDTGGDAASPSPSPSAMPRVAASGKLFTADGERWYVKGLTYGPFAPNADGEFLPERSQVQRDFRQVRDLGANALRVYHVPPVWLLDMAAAEGLRVLIDVPWEKHRCFFEDWSARQSAVAQVRGAARTLGGHPGVFAISVANEIPHDIVRFYGARRVAAFIDELLGTAKEQAPDCLVTYTNYPSTEFLQPSLVDFYCANVYLDRCDDLRRYLDRLQHVAGNLPLILGEYGVDSFRGSRQGQAAALGHHVRQVFSGGLAGSFVFSYTDDWFTGGHPIQDWAFGITDCRRQEKPAAAELRQIWARAPRVNDQPLPAVSVVVCSYNGARTLRECLASLRRLAYPDYEVILVDDGSTDDTPAIAKDFPEVRCIRHDNLGLSAARNTGLRAARGEIVAYTDSDCIADPSWLLYTVQAMREQGVNAIGGPNVAPPSDNWVAKCVAASPGGPSHVMLDDRYAEHVPGCNMAFDRAALLAIGGFDVQFRQAGDDVDICWRFIDAGLKIGYAASALVWHRRRNTIMAYLRQQKGYGRSEAMLQFKHPERFNALGCSRWHGIIYGEGAIGLPVANPRVYHGRFGTGLFQIIYRHNRYSPWAYFTLLEWHVVAAWLFALSAAWLPLAAISAVMWTLTLIAAVRSAIAAPLPRGGPWWCRPVILVLQVLQPIVRSYHRYAWRLSRKRLAGQTASDVVTEHRIAPPPRPKRISWREFDHYWSSNDGRGRELLLAALVERAKAERFPGHSDAEWEAHDVELMADPWHNVRVHTATEELGWPDRFTRVRCVLRATVFARVVTSAVLALLAASAAVRHPLAWGPAALGASLVFASILLSRRRCARNVSRLVHAAGMEAGLKPVTAAGAAGDPAVQPSGGRRAVDVRIAVDSRTCDVPLAFVGGGGGGGDGDAERSAGCAGELSRDEPQGDEAPAMAC